MNRQDIATILLTFITGFAVGMYVYIAGAANFLAMLSTSDQTEVYNYVIVGDRYGGCGSDCPSFRVDSTGSFRFLSAADSGEEQVARDGRLPYGLRQSLDNVLATNTLSLQSQSTAILQCDSLAEGSNVTYRIELSGVIYQLDSCQTAVDTNSELWRSLSRVWEYLEAN